jgi:AcrR family transcriptional regulator
MSKTTRERLVEAGADLFYQHGFQAVGLDRILDEVGITKTAFYKHFESKDELIVAVLEHRDRIDMQEWTVFFRERGGDDARQQLVAVFDLLDDWFGRPDFRGCMFMNATTEFPSPNDPIHQAASKHGANLQAAMVKMAETAGASDAEALAGQLMLLITGAIVARHAGGDANAAATGKVTAEILVDRYCQKKAAAVGKRATPAR